MSILPGRGDDGLEVPPRFEDSKDRLTYLMAEYKIGVYLAIVAATILFATGRLGIPSLPPQAAWGLRWFAVGILPACALAKVAVVDKWIPDPRHKVLIVDLEGGIDVSAELCPRTVWDKRERGEHPALSPEKGVFDYVVTSFEWDEELDLLEVEGVNEELANPLSIVTTQQMLDDVYGTLLEEAAKYEKYQAQERMRRFEVEKRTVNALIGAVEPGLEMDPGTMEQVVRVDEDEAGPTADEKARNARTDEVEERPTLSEMVPEKASGAIEAATDGGGPVRGPGGRFR